MKKLLIIILSVLLLTSCSANENNTTTVATTFRPLSEIKLLLGTQCTISIYDKQEQSIIDKCFDRISELEQKISANDAGTEIDLININAGVEAVKVSKDTETLIRMGVEYSRISEGVFDITIGPLVNLWRIGFDDARLPSQSEINAVLGRWTYKDVSIDNEKVYLEKKGMQLDLGAVAKGYIADEVKKVLVENGVNSAIINLGGNILLVGDKIANDNVSSFAIGIRNPYEDSAKERVGDLRISNKSVVTSGVYERYITVDDKMYHHLLSPTDGYPFENDLLSLSIISDLSVDGDGLSTTVFAKGLQGGLDFINGLKQGGHFSDIEAIFITRDNQVYITDGLQDMFTIANENFTLHN